MPQAEKTAAKLETLIFEVVSLQEDCVHKVCARCTSPCCERVGYLFGGKGHPVFKIIRPKRDMAKKRYPEKGLLVIGTIRLYRGAGVQALYMPSLYMP